VTYSLLVFILARQYHSHNISATTLPDSYFLQKYMHGVFNRIKYDIISLTYRKYDKGENMDFLKRATELNEETVSHRRFFHQTAETGLNMPKAQEYVLNKLSEYGYDPTKCGYGVTATAGTGEPVILLRADMDALPMAEESGEEFACPTGNAHACGHDLHAAMLLTAAKMLKECESELKGTVKFMFQPAEETFEGSRNMIENGILENPKPDAALAFHVTTGKMPLGVYAYNPGGVMMASVDGFRIEIRGKGAHGAYPHSSVDPIMIGVYIHQALQSLIARESDAEKMCVLTIGQFHAGTAANIIPDTAYLEGTLRTDDKAQREKLVKRINEVASSVAETFGGSVKITVLSAVPPLMCDKETTEAFVRYIGEMDIPNKIPMSGVKTTASEDFALICDKIPSALMYVSAGFMDERGSFPAHNPKVRFNEGALPNGAGMYAHCAYRWLEEHQK